MDIGVNIGNLDELVQLIKFLNTMGKKPYYNIAPNFNFDLDEKLLTFPNLDSLKIIYESMNSYPESLYLELNSLIKDVIYNKKDYKLENIELLMKMIIDNKSSDDGDDWDYYYENNRDDNDDNPFYRIFKFYEETGSKVAFDYIIYNLTQFSDGNYFIDELYVWKDTPVFKQVVLALDDNIWNKNMELVDQNKAKEMTNLRNEFLKPIRFLDTAIAFRGANLPPTVVEQIINHAYDTRSTLGLYESMERIEPIINPTPGVTRAARHAAFKDANN